MRKVIVLEFMTLDGVIQAPGGPEEDSANTFKFGGWQAPYGDETADKLIAEQMKQPFSLLLGRKTYDIWVNFWPQHGEMWPGVNESTKYIVSHDSSLKLNWENSVLVSGDVVEEIKKLKNEDGPNLMVWGSADLAQTLLKNDLVDELWLKIFPLTLGTGKRLFVEGTIPKAFKLTKGTITPSGIIYANYEREGEVKTGTVGA